MLLLGVLMILIFVTSLQHDIVSYPLWLGIYLESI